MSVTWTQVSRHRRTTLTVAVSGAPPWELPACVVQPEYVTFWLDNDEVVAVGVEGIITSGKDSRATPPARMATTWNVDCAPTWCRELALDVS
jgi:hypothetical protein